MSADDSKVTIESEVSQLNVERPHVVILGAGASLAATPYGDRFGQKLPLMYNFLDVLGLRSLIERYGITFSGDNFEELYSRWVDDPNLKEFVHELESKIRSYFSSLELPDYPTVYDYLLLSLRPKDVVATFNWDPFLIQAYIRNKDHAPLPQTFFFMDV